MSKSKSQKKIKNLKITSIKLETDSESDISKDDSFHLCEKCNNGFSKVYCEELRNKSSKHFNNSKKKSSSKNNKSNLENIKLKFIEDETQSQRMKKKYGNIYGIDSSLVCNTCHFLPDNPTICYKCNTLFCRKCLEKFVNEKQRCPKCLKLISSSALQKINLYNIYSKTKAKCPFNGCKEFLDLNLLCEHVKECVYKEVKSKKEVKRINKFVILSFEDDPYTKLFYTNYCIEKNKSDISFHNFSTVFNYDEFIENFNNWVKGKCSYDTNLESMNKDIKNADNKVNKDLLDIAKLTKDTNEVIKNMLKH